MTCHRAVTVPQCVEEGLHVYKSGVVGKQPFVRSAFVTRALGRGGLVPGGITRVSFCCGNE